MVLEAEIPRFTAWIGPALLWYLFAGSLLAVIVAAVIKKLLDTPSRKYDPANPNVGSEYDAWTK